MIIITLMLAGIAIALYSTRTLMRIGSGYTAKTVCSGVFVSGRHLKDILADDVVAPGHPLLKLMRTDLQLDHQQVIASLAGAPWTRSRAVYRPGLGCTLLPDKQEPAPLETDPPPSRTPNNSEWPAGSQVRSPGYDRVDTLVKEASEIPGTRAIVVVHKGKIVSEHYAPGIDEEMPLIGWSLAKTVTGLLTGLLVDDGVISLTDTKLFKSWESDERGEISLKHLLHMESGLAFKETYGNVSDVNRMLFLEADMAGFTEALPLGRRPGADFEYVSGSTNLIMQYLRQQFNEQTRWGSFPRERLFEPLGMDSAVLEPDASGNFVGAAYLYASARDWAKIGLLMQKKGLWDGEQLVSSEWIDFMIRPTSQSAAEYGAHVWLRGQGGDDGFDLPDDAFWLLGHDSQSVAVVPSRELVVVRLGLTPDEDSFKPQQLVQGLLEEETLYHRQTD